MCDDKMDDNEMLALKGFEVTFLCGNFLYLLASGFAFSADLLDAAYIVSERVLNK